MAISILVPCVTLHITRVGQNRIYTPYMAVYLVISLSKRTRVYIYCAYKWFWPTLHVIHNVYAGKYAYRGSPLRPFLVIAYSAVCKKAWQCAKRRGSVNRVDRERNNMFVLIQPCFKLAGVGV